MSNKRPGLIVLFKDPVTRPRMLMWSAAVIMVVAALAVGVGVIGTSTRFFCAESCHKVQDDTIASYDASSHSQISCMACHEPVDANTLVFARAKIKALGEIYPTVTDTYKLPLNPGSALALNEEEMGDKQCVQCHSRNRAVNPSRGIIIDHAKHEEAKVWCTVCHNRIAHNETAAPPKLKGNKPHEDFMKMDACFRCHDLDGKKRATGACAACHAAGFELVPASHKASTWFPKGHAEAGSESRKKFEEGKAEAKILEEEGVPKELAEPVEYCSTCHGSGDFCNRCHGVEMPHPTDFTKTHGKAGKATPQVCAKCHAKKGAASGTQFCNNCHHPQNTPGTSWLRQHPAVVRASDPSACFKCHAPTFCSRCHVSLAR